MAKRGLGVFSLFNLYTTRRVIATGLASVSAIVAAAVILVPSVRVAAQTGDSVVRSWSCLVSSAAAGSIFSTTSNPACGIAGKTGRLPLGGRISAADVVAPPGPPSGLGATVSGQTVFLTWNASNTGGSPSAYILQAGSSAGTSNLAASSVGLTTSVTANGVPAGTYFVRVVAANASGTSAPSNEIVVNVGGGGACGLAPAVPTGLTTSSSGSNITISWQRPAVGCAPTSYILQAGSAPGLSNLANFNTGSDSTTFSAGGVGAGTYFIRVIAVNAAGASGPSQDVPLVVGGGSCSGVPGAPTSFLASVSGSTVTFAWQAASGTPSTYVLLAGTSAGATNAGQFDLGNSLSYTATGVPNGTYFVRLQARNACGGGPVSNEVVITVGGSGGGGTPAGPAFATLHGFTGSPADGSNWSTVTQGSDGNLYGTAVTGGPFNSACVTNLTGCGILFRLSPSGAFTVLHNFDGTTADHRQNPIYPYGALLQASDGNFYGTTSEGASVFRMTPGGSVTTLTFLGGNSYADLIQGSDGNLYGTTAFGGEGTCPADRSSLCHPTSGEGTVFRVSLNGSLTTLKVFSGGADGARPYGGLTIGPDGAFYGTTRGGGGSARGTVFRITSGGAFSTIHTFTGADGSFPYPRLTAGGDGNLYGVTTNGGGGQDAGVVFRVSPGGAFTVLHVFTGFSVPDPNPRPGVPLDGAFPAAPLIPAADGTFVGVSASGGAFAGGTLFKISPAGTYSQLFTFAGNQEGSSPIWLVRGSDGAIYGNCQYGGVQNKGAIFRISGL
jgi:uncharacterized repeat protein (TIGR03803 family)